MAGNPTPASTIVLLVISGLATLTCWFTLAGLPALVLAIVALTKARDDLPGAQRLTRIGWIAFGVITAIILGLGVLGVLASVVSGN